MDARELLIDTFVHLAPARALEGFSPADADRAFAGVNHSAAQILAHMCFWQEWFTARCEGVDAPLVACAADGWPAVSPGSWPALDARFVAGLDRLVALAARTPDLSAPVMPVIDFPPLAHLTLHGALVHVAQHNSHHLGQIILLRQMMGAWPPPAGSFTW